VIADAPVNGGEGILRNDALPGCAIAAGLSRREPSLHVLPRRAGVIARGQAVDEYRPEGP
jgi:hypothetical protein